MKCPTCVEEGLRSVVTSLGFSSTLMGVSSFWDEDGDYHVHDPNATMEDFVCSNKHRWTERHKKECQTCKSKENNDV